MQKNKLVGVAKVGEKGQIVIPKDIREMFDINTGDTMVLLGDKNRGLALVKASTVSELTDKIFKDLEDSHD